MKKSLFFKLIILIENISNENVFIKEDKLFYEEKEVLNYSMILLLSGLKENSDVYMLKLWGKGIFKMRLYNFYIE